VPLPQKKLIPGILLMLMIAALAAPPLWWSAGDPPVIVPGTPQNNRGPANIGQAKHMAKSALDALEAIDSDLAGLIEADLVGPGLPIPHWNPPANQAERDKNHAPLLIGQLKAIADPFYNHLHAIVPNWLEAERIANGTNHSGSIFPWTAETTDDNNKGIANIGQLKAVFSLRFEGLATFDSDGDGMPDLWEFVHGFYPNHPGDANADPDGDGIPNKMEFALGTDPNSYDQIGPVNLGFSEEITDNPDLSFRPENPSDLYPESSVPHWNAAIGEHIEIWKEDDGDTYAELQSHWDAKGIEQEFDMLPGTRLTFILRYKGRYDGYSDSNPFKLKVEGAHEVLVNGQPAQTQGSVKLESFMADDTWEKYAEWHYASVSITTDPQATTLIPITLTLIPEDTDEAITYGGFVNLLPVDLIADTDRDGVINSSDSHAKDQWTKQRGAIYTVNFDRDGDKTHNGKPTADAITWWDTTGVPFHEDWKIDNEADKEDISPFKITIPTLPEGTKVYLTLLETEDLHAIHIFPRIKAGQNAVWGGFGTSGRPWTDGDANPLDIEITAWLKPQSDESGHNPATTGVQAGTYTFGLEGLVFRGMTVPGGTDGGKFSGIIDIGMEIQIPGQSARINCGKVKMKVAPFLLTPNDRPTDRVFVNNIANGLQAMHKSAAISATSVWMQDHVEIGHTQRPGGPLMKMTFVCPYNGVLATWPATKLFSDGKGLFALGKNLGGSGGDFGGNIELSHPQENYPLGRILAGDSMSASLRAFLEAQEIQAPLVPNISYTEVQHIDEVLSPGPNNTTYVPGPTEAITLLQAQFDTEEKQIRGILFSPDTVQPAVAKVWKSATATDTPYIITDQNYDDVIDEWSRFNRTEENPQGGFVRLVGGASGGQIGRIKAVTKAVQADGNRIGFAGNPEGKLMIEVDFYFDTGSLASRNWKSNTPQQSSGWYRKPLEGAHVVCVQKSLRWKYGAVHTNPALLTVKEILEDQEFLNFNQMTLPPLIAATATTSGIKNPVKVPCLFYMYDIPEKAEAAAGRPWYAVAYTPNTANLQWVNSNPVNAKPFGPRNTSHEDVMETGIQAVLPGQSLFLDDWEVYHIDGGEIHCGSAAERVAEEEWWAK
jgi:hypothetical protein